MAASSVMGLYPSLQQGSGYGLPNLGELYALAASDSTAGLPLTAHAGGGQGAATPLTNYINTVAVVGTAADSVLLPLALPGASVVVINNAALACQVFGQATNPNTGVGDTIAPHGSAAQAATATGVTQAGAGLTAIYFCFAAGQWKQMYSA